jgi:4-amino-4-deoxy-L-arabinose transferase-like glycosyltransferase
MNRFDVDRLIKGWRGPLLAALVALVAGLPGLIAAPPLDRDESRFAQATAQMLESHDFVNIEFQDAPRHKKPVGIHWLQAVAVSAVSSPEARGIWAYRLPSLLGAMLAAAACAWGATAFFGARGGAAAGVVLASTFILSTEAFIAKTDAVLAGAVTLALAALARLYAQARGGPPAGKRTRLFLWLGMALGVLVKGPIAPLVFGLTLISLAVWDRDNAWMKKIGWLWGLVLVLAIVGPWAIAITVASDGGFWAQAFGSDVAPKLMGGQEKHGGWPGYHTLLLPVLFYPGTLLLAAAAVVAWQRRAEPGVRFALCWLIPIFVLFELAPTKLPHYTLPAYGGLAFLVAAAVTQPIGTKTRWAGLALALLPAAVISAAAIWLLGRYGDAGDTVWVSLTIGFALIGAAISGFFLLGRSAGTGLMVACAFGVLCHAALMAGVAPNLKPLWVSRNIAKVLKAHNMDPRNGVTPGPVAIAGYSEPSVVFLLGTDVDLRGAEEAADAVAQRRPAIVELKEDAAFRAAVAQRNLQVEPVATIKGYNYSRGEALTLTLYKSRGVPQ